MKQIWHSFRNDLPLRRKFTVINLLALSVTLVMSVIILVNIRRVIVSDSIRSGEAVVTQTASALNATIKNVIAASDSVSSAGFLNRLVYGGDVESFLSEEHGGEDAEDFFSRVDAVIDGSVITNVKIYLPQVMQDVCDRYATGQVFMPVQRVRGSYWHGIFAGQPERTALLCPSFYLTTQESASLGELAYITRLDVTSPAKGQALDQTDGYLAVYFSRSSLDEILQENRAGEDSISYLENSRQAIAASSNPATTAIYFLEYGRIPEEIGGSGFAELNILDQSLYMAYREIEGTDWRLVSVIPRNSLYREGRLFSRIALVYVIVVILSMVLQVILSGSISQRITGITHEIGQQRPIALPTEQTARDEIGQLTKTYNSMLERLSQLAKEQTETAEKLKVSEVRALQAQINPHFLYNMLDMINWLSIAGNQEGVSEAVRSLSRFYKLTLSGKDIMTTVGAELQHVKLYVKLQNMRFEDKIHFLVDVPEELEDCQIPKLVLQPIVENAILHGIFEKENKEGSIVITGWEEPGAGREGDLVLTVSDDGAGMSKEQLSRLKKGEKSSTGTGTNVAIANTHNRLALLYGTGYGLSFSSAPGAGCEVTIRIRKG